jgi:hypothetical protein
LSLGPQAIKLMLLLNLFLVILGPCSYAIFWWFLIFYHMRFSFLCYCFDWSFQHLKMHDSPFFIFVFFLLFFILIMIIFVVFFVLCIVCR